MSRSPRRLELLCRGCGWRQNCGPGEIGAWLRTARKIRANRSPDLGVLYELFRTSAAAFACPKCGAAGLDVREGSDESDWPGPTPCAACGKPIAPERLEALPGVRLCAACQGAGERGRRPAERDLCTRCGAPLEVRVVRRGGSTRYVLGCSGHPPCDLE